MSLEEGRTSKQLEQHLQGILGSERRWKWAGEGRELGSLAAKVGCSSSLVLTWSKLTDPESVLIQMSPMPSRARLTLRLGKCKPYKRA
jgi:hypothetical protein